MQNSKLACACLRKQASKCKIEISARHVHLTATDFAKLFGPAAHLTQRQKLSQADDFAAEETVTVKVGGRQFDGVRIVGPFRSQSQVEISRTDARQLKADVPLRVSGDLAGSAPVTLAGPRGEVKLTSGLIVAWRHLHVSPAEAKRLGVTDRQMVGIAVTGPRAGRLDQCVVRVAAGFHQTIHLDTDEGNALDLNASAEGLIIVKNE
jgi:propanediol utilization protein